MANDSGLSRDKQSIKAELRRFIVAEYLPGESPESLKDDTQLKATAILDSLTTLQVIAHLEKSYGIVVEPHEAASEFDTLEDIATMVERKL